MKSVITTLAPYVEDGSKVMLSIILACAVIIFIINGTLAITFRYPLDYGEAPLVDQAMRLASGQNIYRRDLTSPPYTISNYPPLYVLTMAPFVKLFGPNFWVGRMISFVCTIASALFLSLLIHTFTRDRTASWATGLLFLSIPYVVSWSPLARIDMLALALSTAGLYVIARWPDSSRHLILSGVLLAAAAYTRQSYGLAAPLAAFVWLWTNQGWRQALKLAGLVGGIGLILFLILNLLTRGGFFFNIITANTNEFEMETVTRHWRELRALAPLLLIFSGAFLFMAFKRLRAWPLLAPYLIGATLSAATIGKIGSNVNYLLELSAALSLMVGIVIGWSKTTFQRNINPSPLTHKDKNHRGNASGAPWSLYLRGALMIMIAIQAAFLMRATLQDPVQRLKGRIKSFTEIRDLEGIVEKAEDPILADEFMGLLTLQNQPLVMQPFEVTQLANAGLWDQSPLLESIREQEYPLILIHHFMMWPVYKSRWTPEMLSTIMDAYEPTDFLAETLVYRPLETGETRPRARTNCPGAPWIIPTEGHMGMWWFSKSLRFMGDGLQGTVPVYAVADGLLTRRSDWTDAVAIQHDDPVRQGETAWTFYSGMASSWDNNSFIAKEFPPGSVEVPVRKGQLLGYQGRVWDGATVWVHGGFAVVPAMPDGAFPAALVARATPDDPPLPYELEEMGLLDPSPYLGTIRSRVMGTPTWLPMRCGESSR